MSSPFVLSPDDYRRLTVPCLLLTAAAPWLACQVYVLLHALNSPPVAVFTAHRPAAADRVPLGSASAWSVGARRAKDRPEEGGWVLLREHLLEASAGQPAQTPSCSVAAFSSDCHVGWGRGPNGMQVRCEVFRPEGHQSSRGTALDLACGPRAVARNTAQQRPGWFRQSCAELFHLARSESTRRSTELEGDFCLEHRSTALCQG